MTARETRPDSRSLSGLPARFVSNSGPHARSVAVLHSSEMATGDNIDDADVLDLERELVRLPEVEIARIVCDDDGRLLEVHIVANADKHPKQVVRDVQSVALASFGIEIDRRIVSVVQLAGHLVDPETASGETSDRVRVTIESVSAEVTGLRCLVKVGLGRGEATTLGYAEGSIATSARFRLVASATVDALRQLEPVAECVDIDAAQIVRVGGLDVAIVTAVFVTPPHEQVVAGSAVVAGHDESGAVVRAVLDATNRKLVRLARDT